MIETARIVLQDCKFAIRNYSIKLQSEELRICWISILSLLRTVGHVLDKVDKKKSRENEQAISEWWQTIVKSKPEPKIFWEFIDKYRNEMLKTYNHGIERYMTINGPEINGKKTYFQIDNANSRGGTGDSPGSVTTSYLKDGVFAGQYEKDIANQAYDWWSLQLDLIDQRIVEIEKTTQ